MRRLAAPALLAILLASFATLIPAVSASADTTPRIVGVTVGIPTCTGVAGRLNVTYITNGNDNVLTYAGGNEGDIGFNRSAGQYTISVAYYPNEITGDDVPDHTIITETLLYGTWAQPTLFGSKVLRFDCTTGEIVQPLAFTSPAPNSALSGDTYVPTAVGGDSGNPVTFSIDPRSAGVCTITGGTVSFRRAGTCTIDADQAAAAGYFAAARASQSVAVGATQTITFAALPDVRLPASPLMLKASASSGLPVTFSSSTRSVCTTSGAKLILAAAGRCTVEADQAGNGSFSSAPSVSRSFTVTAAPPLRPVAQGYWVTTTKGAVRAFGAAANYGSTATLRLFAPVVAMATTPSRHGYWLAAADGGVFSFGDAHSFGSAATRRLAAPVVGFAATPTGHGYWLVTRTGNGKVAAYGDAVFHGSRSGLPLSRPVAGLVRTKAGYILVAADGGVFTFGDARFFGSAVGMAGSAVASAAIA